MHLLAHWDILVSGDDALNADFFGVCCCHPGNHERWEEYKTCMWMMWWIWFTIPVDKKRWSRGLRSDPFVHVGLIFMHFISCLITLNHVISPFFTYSHFFSCFLMVSHLCVFFFTFSHLIKIKKKQQQPSNLSLLYRRFNPVWLSNGCEHTHIHKTTATHPWRHPRWRKGNT